MTNYRGMDDILLDYYNGAYGPTIRIDTQTRSALIRLKDLFRRLAESSDVTLDLVQAQSVQATGLHRLVLTTVPGVHASSKTLERVKGDAGQIAFIWAMPSDEWDETVDLVDGLLETD